MIVQSTPVIILELMSGIIHDFPTGSGNRDTNKSPGSISGAF